MSFKNFFHILNPNHKNMVGVRRFFARHPELQCMWIDRTSHPTHLETVVLWAFNEGHRDIVVWGGDGTLSRVVQAISELHAFDVMRVGLVPAGTCNDLGRYFGFSGWRKVADMGLTDEGLDHSVDVGVLEAADLRRTFINNAGFGRTRERLRKKSNPVSDILSFEPKRLDLDWETAGAHHFETRKALLGVVCNAPYFNRALHFDKAANPSDGKLNGYFESPQRTGCLLWKFARARLGGALLDKNTFCVEGGKIRVDSDADLYPQVDGEPAGDAPQRSLTFSILQTRLRLCLWS